MSRRDFLKLGAAGIAATAAATLLRTDAHALGGDPAHERSEFVFSMRERLSIESQEFLRNHHINTLNYEGRTVSIDDPSIADDTSLANHLDLVVGQLRNIELAGQKPNPIASYKGDVTPPDVHLNFDRTTFTVGRTEKNELLTQTTIGKVNSNGIAETEFDFNQLRKSMLVSKQGKENNQVWFDNVRTVDMLRGKTSQILVNAKQGTVFQLTYDTQNVLQSAFSGLRGSVALERLNDAGTSMEIAFLPSSPAFLTTLNGLKSLLTNKGTLFQAQGRIDEMYESVFSPRATAASRSAFFQALGIDEQTLHDSGMGVLNTLYSTDFPTNMDMSVQFMGAYRFILEILRDQNSTQAYLNEANQKGLLFSSLIPQESVPTSPDDAGQKLREVTNSILQKEILLPNAIPQLHILQMRNNLNPSEVKQVLVARYPADDTSVLNSFATTVIPGEQIEYISDVGGTEPMDVFGYGMFNSYDKETLARSFKSIGNTQYTDGSHAGWSADMTQKLYGWSVDPTAGVLEARQNYVRLYYDPAANGSRLFTGMELPIKDGVGKIVELRPGSMKSKNFTTRVQSSNRSVWFTGDYPYSILDVTDKVIELRKKGFTTASQFGFMSPPEAAEMVYGLSGAVDYSRIEQFLGAQRDAMIQYGNPGGIFDSAHSILIAQNATQCTRYRMEEKSSWWGFVKTKEYVASGTEQIEKNTLLRAYELMTINGKKMVVVAKNKDDGTLYAVPETAMQFVGVDSDMMIDLQKAIIAAAIIWGGYKIYSIPSVSGALETLSKALVKAVFK
jgi:hypothetical protein